MDTTAPSQKANIGVSERRKRLTFGIGALSVGVVIAVLLIGIRAPLAWRLPLFLPFCVGALGVFQARDKT